MPINNILSRQWEFAVFVGIVAARYVTVRDVIIGKPVVRAMPFVTLGRVLLTRSTVETVRFGGDVHQCVSYQLVNRVRSRELNTNWPFIGSGTCRAFYYKCQPALFSTVTLGVTISIISETGETVHV